MKVRIKTWEELLATPNVILNSATHYIELIGQATFTNGMKNLCGRIIEFEHPYTEIEDGNSEWLISPWMVTEIKSHNFKIIYDILNEE